MYTDYFGFKEQPFRRIKSDPRFFYSNAIYEKAYGSILSGILERKGVMVLTGEAGTGKTALIRKCMDSLDSNIRFVFFANSVLSFENVLDYLCEELELPVRDGEYFNKTRVLKAYLLTQLRKGQVIALLIDDADNMEKNALNSLLSLCHTPNSDENILQIILVGLPELREKLADKEATLCHIAPLRSAEVGAFIRQQLTAVGCKRNDLFTPEAIRHIAAYSKGIPRSICSLCDSALFNARYANLKSIAPDMIEEAAQQCLLSEGPLGDLPALKTDVLPAAVAPEQEEPTQPEVGSNNQRAASYRPHDAAGTEVEQAAEVAPRADTTGDALFKRRTVTARPPRRSRTALTIGVVVSALLLIGSLVLIFNGDLIFPKNTPPAMANRAAAPAPATSEPPVPLPPEPEPDALAAMAQQPVFTTQTAKPPAPLTTDVNPDKPVVAEHPQPSGSPGIVFPELSRTTPQSTKPAGSPFQELGGGARSGYNTTVNRSAISGQPVASDETRRVAQLLEHASRQLAAEQFTAPVGDNALTTYRQVLRLKPGYGEALYGIDTIKQHYVKLARAAAKVADWEKAKALYETAIMVDPTDRRLARDLQKLRNRN